jgi:glycerol-3-phosphate acyltransferase PlsY
VKIALLLIVSYLLGSIPFGVIVGRAWRGVDVRKHGSGNIGFANVLRVLGPGPGLVVLLGDALKGLGPVLIGRSLLNSWLVRQPDLWLLAVALAPILGHSFSVFLRFRGGRGVATTAGTLLGMCWAAALVALGVWLLVVGVTRYISLGSMLAACTVPLYMALSGIRFEWGLFWSAVAALVIARHIPNLGRLLEGTETRVGQGVTLAEEGDASTRDNSSAA